MNLFQSTTFITTLLFTTLAHSQTIPVENVSWTQLNPARGSSSPQAGALWGDRTAPGSAGFLLKPVDGFSSPPHIHNTAYRGIVISGLIHNDDPQSPDRYMTTASYWTQPAGDIHITAAKGSQVLAYIEVEDQFGVQPPQYAFTNSDVALNMDKQHLVWRPVKPATETTHYRPETAWLWGTTSDGKLNGRMIKLAPQASIRMSTIQPTRMVVIAGQLKNKASPGKVLTPGSYLGAEQATTATPFVQPLTCLSDSECLIYIRTQGEPTFHQVSR